MNQVFLTRTDKRPMLPRELAKAANALLPKPVLTQWDFSSLNPDNRLGGDGHCNCGGNGEFVLLPLSDPDVQEGKKRYMQCRKCGCWSHL